MKYPHIRQHDEKDCGAACLSMICEYYGLKLPLAKFRNIIKVDNHGANVYGIVKGADLLGLDADALEGTKEELLQAVSDKEIKYPFIARIVNEDGYEHFIVVYDINDKFVRIGDPGKLGIIKISVEMFFHQWQGQVVTFVPNENFTKKNERKGTVKKFFSLVLKQKKTVFAVFLLSLIVSGIGIASSLIFEYVIDDAVNVGSSSEVICDDENCEEDHDHSNTLHSDRETFLTKLMEKADVIFANLKTVCVSIIILYIIQAVLKVLRGYMLAVFSRNIDIPLSLGYYDHMLDLPADFFGTRKTGELISRFSDAGNIRNAISTSALTLMLDTVTAIVTGIFLFKMSGKLFIIALITMVVYAVIVMFFRLPIKLVNQNVMESNAQITAYLKESVDGIETIKADGYETHAKKKTAGLFSAFLSGVIRGSVVYSVQEALASLVGSVGLVLILWMGAYLCIDNVITVGTLITFYYLLSFFVDPVKNLIELQPALQTAVVAAERLNDVMDADVEDNTKKEAESLFGDISICDVDFRYGNRKPVLKNININIKKGSKVAIVGESGCGKTTLAKLLLSFYRAENGSISVNGTDIGDYSPRSVRKHVSYIPQDIFLFSDTVYNNLRYGDESVTDEEIEDICRKCLADDFIKSLPLGYNTILEENGKDLSGGQKQRLAIARALLRKPDILIMDEATSNLDTATEEGIRRMIDDLSESTTCIIIAHRLSTIRNCDHIYVMDNGEIAEEGTHDELMNKKSIYAGYVSCQ